MSATAETRNQIWKKLCQDRRWKHNKPTDDTTYLYFCGSEERWDVPSSGENSTWKAVPVPEGFHTGATAPHFVWEKKPIKIKKETETTYLRRLICALDGRFVCLIDPDLSDDEDCKTGIPKIADRYCWRYWDNDKNVYQDFGIKWTTRVTESTTASELASAVSPGDFTSRGLWMFTHGFVDRDFWDAVWLFQHHGSTGSLAWDEALIKLQKQASVPVKPLNEARLDRLAQENGWTKITDNSQPNMASYRKDGQRMNFYLTTGTVGTCLEHPSQGKTQMFRREIKMPEAAILFGNPRTHTGRGYKRKRETRQIGVVETRRIGVVRTREVGVIERVVNHSSRSKKRKHRN